MSAFTIIHNNHTGIAEIYYCIIKIKGQLIKCSLFLILPNVFKICDIVMLDFICPPNQIMLCVWVCLRDECCCLLWSVAMASAFQKMTTGFYFQLIFLKQNFNKCLCTINVLVSHLPTHFVRSQKMKLKNYTLAILTVSCYCFPTVND